MSAPPSEDLVWEEHMERWRRFSRRAAMHRGTELSSSGGEDALQALASEWTAAPPGRLGRRLLADIEPYLEFFALARLGAGEGRAGHTAIRQGVR
jgi:hypothetical protein